MIQINPLKSYIDGGVRAALTTPPSASLVFDLPGKAIWVKGVKLKGTDHTYTFNHDNYITLTNTPDKNNPESEDIKIGVNITTLKNIIDTTYNGGTLTLLLEGLNTEERTWLAKILHNYINNVLPVTKNLKINGTNYAIYTTADSLPLFFVPTSLGATGQILACTSSGLSWIDLIQNTDYRVSLSSATSNSDYRIILKQGADNNPETNFVRFSEYLTFNPSTKTLKINNIKVITAADIYVGSNAGLVPSTTSAQLKYYLRGDGTWANIATEMATANTWRPIKVENTDILGSGTSTGTLSFTAGTGITLSWDATNKRIIITNSSPDINHNTDETVRQVPKTDNVNRPLMMINGGTSAGEQINTSMFSTGIYANASTKMITANGFIKAGSSDDYVLLGGGNHKALSDFSMAHEHPYLPLAGGTMTGTLIIPYGNNLRFGNIYEQSDTWDITSIGSNLGITILNAIGRAGTSAPSSYAVGLSISGYYSMQIAAYGGGERFWIRANTDGWRELYHSGNLTASVIGNLGTLSNNITGNATTATNADSAYILNIKSINSETDIIQSGIRGYSGSGSSWTGSISSMKYAAIFSFGNPSRGWLLWAGRTGEVGNGLCWRRGILAATSWDSERLILDSVNYTEYTVKKDGIGASGTWGINISGNATTASSATIANQAYNLYYYSADTDEGCKNSKGSGLSFWYTKSLGTSRPTGGDSFMLVMGDTSLKYNSLLCFDMDSTDAIYYRSSDSTPTWRTWAKILTSVSTYVASDGTNRGIINGVEVASARHLLINGATWNSDWHWSGQSGQPSWLWGSNDGINMYVWNPSNFSVNYANSAGNADTVDGYHASNLVKFYLSPMTSDAPADSAKSWFVNTMPSGTGAIVYNVPGSEKTIIAGKSTGAYGHMLQLNYDDNYLRILRYQGSWKTTDWEKISAGYADSAGSVAWSGVTGKPSTFAPSSHTHSYLSLSGGTLNNDSMHSTLSLDSTNGSADAWNKEGNTMLRFVSNNNAMVFSIGSPINERTGFIQVGHADANNYAYVTSSLHLNKLGGTVYINNNVAWHAGNDGSGSGLDADLLDGNHASAFAAASHTHSQYLTLHQSLSNRLYTFLTSLEQNSDPYTWIRNEALNSLRGHCYNTSGLEWQYLWGISSGKSYGNIIRATYGNGNPAMQIMGLYSGSWTTWRTVCVLDGSNNLTISGSYYANSDIRYKLIQSLLLNKLNFIAELPIFTYYWNDNLHDDKLHIGSSAQAVNEIFPELITYDESKDFYNLDYATLGTIAGITACKELVTLKSELLQLKEKVKLLEDKLRKYENTL